MSALQPRNVRTRLTIWYVTVLAGVLLLYVGGASALVFFQLRSELDRFGIDDLETVEGLLSFGSDGKVSLHSDYHDHPYTANMQDRLLEVWSGDGTLLYRNELLGNRDLGGRRSLAKALTAIRSGPSACPTERPLALSAKSISSKDNPR